MTPNECAPAVNSIAAANLSYAERQREGERGLWAVAAAATTPSRDLENTLAEDTTGPFWVLDRFIVTGSDGLWDVVGAAEVARVLHAAHADLAAAAQQLVARADAQWRALHTAGGAGDNVTVSMVHVQQPALDSGECMGDGAML